jgi:hypothetical protein
MAQHPALQCGMQSRQPRHINSQPLACRAPATSNRPPRHNQLRRFGQFRLPPSLLIRAKTAICAKCSRSRGFHPSSSGKQARAGCDSAYTQSRDSTNPPAIPARAIEGRLPPQPASPQQRTNDPTLRKVDLRMNARKPLSPCPAQKLAQNRLRLIVQRVRRGHSITSPDASSCRNHAYRSRRAASSIDSDAFPVSALALASAAVSTRASWKAQPEPRRPARQIPNPRPPQPRAARDADAPPAAPIPARRSAQPAPAAGPPESAPPETPTASRNPGLQQRSIQCQSRRRGGAHARIIRRFTSQMRVPYTEPHVADTHSHRGRCRPRHRPPPSHVRRHGPHPGLHPRRHEPQL